MNKLESLLADVKQHVAETRALDEHLAANIARAKAIEETGRQIMHVGAIREMLPRVKWTITYPGEEVAPELTGGSIEERIPPIDAA